MSAPNVYAAINAVAAALAKQGIAKNHLNQADDYKYRSIDDVLDRLAPLLAEHQLCVFPRVLERTVTERRDDAQHLLLHVALRVKYTLVSAEDGSRHQHHRLRRGFGCQRQGDRQGDVGGVQERHGADLLHPDRRRRGSRPQQPQALCQDA